LSSPTLSFLRHSFPRFVVQSITDHKTIISFSICDGRGCVSFCPRVPCSWSSFLCNSPRSTERLYYWRLGTHSILLLFSIICHGFKWGLGFPGWTNWFMVDVDNIFAALIGIVLLNILIAVVSDSFTKFEGNSEREFWHNTRVMKENDQEQFYRI